MIVTDLGADLLACLLDKRAHGPVSRGATDAENEVFEQLAAARRVHNLGMELESVEAFLGVLDCSVLAIGSGGYRAESPGQLGEFVPMAVPDFKFAAELFKEGTVGFDHFENARPVFPAFRMFNTSAQMMAHELHAVADAEHRESEGKNGGVGVRGVFGINARRSAAEDDALGVQRLDFLCRRVEAKNLGVDIALPDPSGDDLSVLGAEVEYDDGGMGSGGHGVRKTVLWKAVKFCGSNQPACWGSVSQSGAFANDRVIGIVRLDQLSATRDPPLESAGRVAVGRKIRFTPGEHGAGKDGCKAEQDFHSSVP